VRSIICLSFGLVLFPLGFFPTAKAEAPAARASAFRVDSGWPKPGHPIVFGPVSAVATDKADRVFVFHRGPHPVAIFEREGRYLGAWNNAEIKKPHGFRIDAEGNAWITDIGDHTVKKFTLDGKRLLSIGTPGKSGGGPDHFNQPTDVAVHPTTGEVFVSDGYGNARVIVFSKDGKYLREWGTRGTRAGEFHLPHAILFDRDGRLLVGDRENNRIQVFDTQGKHLETWTESGAPYGLSLGGDGSILVADGRANQVIQLDSGGKRLAAWGRKGTRAGEFDLPHTLCVDSHGDLYVTDINGKRIQKFHLDTE